MRIWEIKKEGRKALEGRWGFGILLLIITIVINSIIPNIAEMLFGGGFSTFFSQDGPPLIAQLVSWIFMIALFPVIYGNSITFLEMVRDEPVTVKNLFQGFEANRYFKIIGTYLLTGIYTLLWLLLFIIPGFIKSIAYSQAYYILKDNPELSPNAAITRSRQLMNGYKGKYFLLNLSFIGWGILCILTLGIGFLWLAPYITASLAAFYQSLVKASNEKVGL